MGGVARLKWHHVFFSCLFKRPVLDAQSQRDRSEDKIERRNSLKRKTKAVWELCPPPGPDKKLGRTATGRQVFFE